MYYISLLCKTCRYCCSYRPCSKRTSCSHVNKNNVCVNFFFFLAQYVNTTIKGESAYKSCIFGKLNQGYAVRISQAANAKTYCDTCVTRLFVRAHTHESIQQPQNVLIIPYRQCSRVYTVFFVCAYTGFLGRCHNFFDRHS